MEKSIINIDNCVIDYIVVLSSLRVNPFNTIIAYKGLGMKIE